MAKNILAKVEYANQQHDRFDAVLREGQFSGLLVETAISPGRNLIIDFELKPLK